MATVKSNYVFDYDAQQYRNRKGELVEALPEGVAVGMEDCLGQKVNVGDLVIVAKEDYNAYKEVGKVLYKGYSEGKPCVRLLWISDNIRSTVPWFSNEIRLAEPEDLI